MDIEPEEITENNSGTIDPVTSLEIAKGFNIKIYSIGMGKDGQAQLPVYLDNGRGGTVKRYRPIHSKVNEDLLKRMADETSGKFYRVADSLELKSVFRDIDQLEKTKIETNQWTKYEELFPKYLLWGLFLLFTGILLRVSIFRRLP